MVSAACTANNLSSQLRRPDRHENGATKLDRIRQSERPFSSAAADFKLMRLLASYVAQDECVAKTQLIGAIAEFEFATEDPAKFPTAQGAT